MNKPTPAMTNGAPSTTRQRWLIYLIKPATWHQRNAACCHSNEGSA